MTRGNVLASVLYRTAVSLKNSNFKKLVWKHNRDKFVSSLAAMQFLTGCIGLKSISLLQVEEIISVLRVEYGYDVEEFSDLLKEASAESDYSIEYEDLLFQMHFILSECINSIVQTRKCNIDAVSRYIKAFHNFPRAFLSLDDGLKISPKDAIEYSKSYLKLN